MNRCFRSLIPYPIKAVKGHYQIFGFSPKAGARGFILNATPETMIKFLNWGTLGSMGPFDGLNKKEKNLSQDTALTHREIFDYNGRKIEIHYTDITQIQADAIVSSDDNHLTMSGGVSMAIHQKGGDVVWEESRGYIHSQIGTAVITSAGNLHAKYVIHALVIDLDNWKKPDPDIVKNAVMNCLEKANSLKCKSIAMPALGTGAGALPVEIAADIMLDIILAYIERTTIQQVLLVLNRKDFLFDFFKASVEKIVKNQYNAKLTKLKQEKEQLIQELREKSPYRNLPFPIAVTRHTIESHGAYHSKFTSTIECAESIIKFCATIVLAETLRIKPEKSQEIFEFFNQNASLGSWVMQLERGLKILQNQNTIDVISEIRKFYFSKNKGFLKEIIKTRNTEHAHGSTRSDSAYEKLYNDLIVKLDILIEDIQFLGQYPLIIVTQIDLSDVYFEYELITIMGDNIIFPKEDVKFRDLRLSKNNLYILDQGNQQALPLAPFLIFETCPVCHIQETFFIEITNENESTYHTYRVNYRLKTDKYIHWFLREH